MPLPVEYPRLAGVGSIPAEPGSYALVLRLEQSHNIQVGRLRTTRFQAGIYIYLGSAQGPGGLRARLDHHQKGEGALHWHIDYLRRYSYVTAIYYLTNSTFQQLCAVLPADRFECRWSQTLANLPGAAYPMPGFGASDCQAGCPAHLVRFDSVPEHLHAYLAQAAGVAQLSFVD